MRWRLAFQRDIKGLLSAGVDQIGEAAAQESYGVLRDDEDITLTAAPRRV